MADIKAYLKQIETVDDYLKFKSTVNKNGALHLQNSKPLGSLADFYDDNNHKPKNPKQSHSDFEFPLYKDNNASIAKSQYLGDSNFLTNFKENLIPKELKDDKNLNKLSKISSDIKIFGQEMTNESLVENSFLNQFSISKKNFNLKNMIEVEKPKKQPEFDKKAFPAPPSHNIANNGLPLYTNPYQKITKSCSASGGFDSSNKFVKPTTLAMNNGIYNKYKLPERPDSTSNFIDNNDIRAYLNSLESKVVLTDNKSQNSSSKARSNSSNNTRTKGKKKNKKMDLSIIEDDLEGEEQDNCDMNRKNKKKKKHQPINNSDSEPEETPKPKRKHKKSRYEEDLTKNFSEKELSLYSANHFNENYKKLMKKDFSEKSLPSQFKEPDYLKNKYGKYLPAENEMIKFLDNISEVTCLNCNELIDLNEVDNHSVECLKALNKNTNPEDISTINIHLKQTVFRLKRKLKHIKEYINKHEDSQHFYFNYILMIIECLQQIITNDQNIVKLVSNIKDINAFNKSLNENETPLSKFILSITYKIKPIAKLKISYISPSMTWEEAKNLREKSVMNQNFESNQSQIMRGNTMGSVRQSNRFFMNSSNNNNNISMISAANQGTDSDAQIKKEFVQMVVNLKLNLDRNHPGRNIKADDLYNDVKKLKLNKERWMEFIDAKFNELHLQQEKEEEYRNSHLF